MNRKKGRRAVGVGLLHAWSSARAVERGGSEESGRVLVSSAHFGMITATWNGIARAGATVAGTEATTMVGARTDRGPVAIEARDWYFDEDGTLAPAPPAGHASRLLEYLGLAYAMVALTLGSPAWCARDGAASEPGQPFAPEKPGVAA
jgi:hypothetical protein